MANRKVLITGASGLLGRAVYQAFQSDSSWQTLGQAYSRAKGGLLKVDLTQPEDVHKMVLDTMPSVVIHTAAERRPDVVEHKPEATHLLNVSATEHLCQEAAKIGAILLFISTDYVFDGKKPPYSVDAQPNPLNKYGKSKLDGERVVMETNKDNMVLRVPILYGDIEYLDESAVTTLFAKVKDTSKEAKMCNYQRRFPTHCNDVAKVILELVGKRMQDPSLNGIFHWSGDECMTKYTMAETMGELFQLPTHHIKADMSAAEQTAVVNRPYDVHLEASRVESLGICHRTPFRDGIAACLQSFA